MEGGVITWVFLLVLLQFHFFFLNVNNISCFCAFCLHFTFDFWNFAHLMKWFRVRSRRKLYFYGSFFPLFPFLSCFYNFFHDIWTPEIMFIWLANAFLYFSCYFRIRGCFLLVQFCAILWQFLLESYLCCAICNSYTVFTYFCTIYVYHFMFLVF